VSGLKVDILAHFVPFCGVFMVQCVKMMLNFLNLGFDCICLSPKCNLPEPFLPGLGITQVRWKIGCRQTRRCRPI